MISNLSARTVLVLLAVVGTVGLVESITDEVWDLTAVFTLILLLSAVLLGRSSRGRVTLTLRRDLAAWLRERAATTDEPIEAVTDRAVAAARSSMVTGGPTT